MTSKEFLEDALDGFAKLKKELREDMEERDLRDSFVRAIVKLRSISKKRTSGIFD